MHSPLLDIRDLSLRFRTPRGPLKALRRVSLDIGENEVLGLVGESGCGKTTLIASILRLMAENAVVDNGEIMFEGRDLLGLGPAALRDIRGNRMSMIFQDPMTSLNPVLSIGAQMLDKQYREKLSKAGKRRRAEDMLAKVGIPDPASRLDQYPHHFSGGMRQRITIAMALLAEPRLLIADEPTTALDATLEVQIIQLLRELQESIGCSILFISHHLNVIAELCDSVVVMYAGEIVERGTVRDIFHRPSHPYTRALLQCDPSIIKEATRRLPTIPGEIPNLIHLPQGCIFRERCPEAMDICAQAPPASYRVSDAHVAACYLLREKEVA